MHTQRLTYRCGMLTENIKKTYNLVIRKDHKPCPKQATRCEECKIVFQDDDMAVIKTKGMRQRVDKKGKLTKYYSIIYLLFLTECHNSHDKNFLFKHIQVSICTKELLPTGCKEMLAKFGVNFS